MLSFSRSSATISGVRQWMAQLTAKTRALLVAGIVGFAVLVAAWWVGPGLFGTGPTAPERVVTASVMESASCADPNAEATVSFELDGQTREAVLSACGHSDGEQLEVAVPMDSSGEVLTVRAAEAQVGQHDLRRPIGLLLVALSSLSGGTYAFVLCRAQRSLATSGAAAA